MHSFLTIRIDQWIMFANPYAAHGARYSMHTFLRSGGGPCANGIDHAHAKVRATYINAASTKLSPNVSVT